MPVAVFDQERNSPDRKNLRGSPVLFSVGRLHMPRKKAEKCHSERRVCAKNPSWSFAFNREGFFSRKAGSE